MWQLRKIKNKQLFKIYLFFHHGDTYYSCNDKNDNIRIILKYLTPFLGACLSILAALFNTKCLINELHTCTMSCDYVKMCLFGLVYIFVNLFSTQILLPRSLLFLMWIIVDEWWLLIWKYYNLIIYIHDNDDASSLHTDIPCFRRWPCKAKPFWMVEKLALRVENELISLIIYSCSCDRLKDKTCGRVLSQVFGKLALLIYKTFEGSYRVFFNT